MSVEVTITVSQGGETIRIEDERRLHKTTNLEPDRLRLDTIDVLCEFLRVGKVCRREELQVLGHHLYDLLLQGEVRTFFEKALDRVPPGERMRVQLTFEESAAEFSGLPWEYMWSPARKWFSTAVDLVLSRFMPSEEPAEGSLDPGESPLRILIMVSQPDTLSPVVAAPVIEAIEKLHESHAVTIDRHVGPTADTFVEILEKYEPHVLHFMGHGRFRRSEQPPRAEVALVDEYANPPIYWCRDQDFAEYFVQARSRPRLVFMHMCESGATAAGDFHASFGGIAPQLISRARIPAVVAMQYPIENRYAIQFSRAFYKEIAKSARVDEAVQSARFVLARGPSAYDNRVFGTPVLYMYARDAIIRPQSAPTAGPHARSSTPVSAATDAPPESAPTVPADATAAWDRPSEVVVPDANGAGVRPHGILVSQPGNQELYAMMRDARRNTRARIDAAAIAAEAKEGYVRVIAELLNEIRNEPARRTEILDGAYAQASDDFLRQLINMIDAKLADLEAK